MVREAHELLDGSRPIPIDKITYELSQNIILAFDNNENINNKDIQIEIEGRVGLVIDKNKNRIKLPINTDAIIENNYSDFQAGIDRESFEYLLDYFHNMTLKKRLSIRNNDNNNNDNNNNNNNNNHNNNNNNNNNNIYILNSRNNTNQTHTSDKNVDGKNQTCNYSYDKRNACIYDFLELKTTKSIDKYYVIKNNNSRIRTTTYLNDENKEETESMMIQSLQKDNLNLWNVYTGNNYDYFDDDDEEDDDYNNNNNNNNVGIGTKTNIATTSNLGLSTSKSQHINYNSVDKNDSIDYRISINIEYTKPISKLYLSKNTPVHERLKERTTFINTYLGLQVDMTKIKNKNNDLYEIEIEIPSKTIFKAMSNLRNKNDSNYLHFICSNLVNNIRGICSQLNIYKKSKHILKSTIIPKLNNNNNNNNDNNNQINISSLSNHLNDLELSSKEKEKFKKYIHSVLPIVGDYMYRVVTKNEKHIQRKIKDQLITKKQKINIFKNNLDIRRHNKKSLQTINEIHVENKWKAFKKGTKIEVHLCSDDEEYEQNEDVQDINYEHYDQYKNEEDESLYINNIYMHTEINNNDNNNDKNNNDKNNNDKNNNEQNTKNYKEFYDDT
ncbi:RNA triphosphatase [Plasmodium sp. DRC-Itaito]|nr:RNA triphosphatase [Plasmodium sp. DRC-Itaito]